MGTDSDSSDFYPTQVINQDNSPYFAHLLACAVPQVDDESEFEDDPYAKQANQKKTNENSVVHMVESEDEEDDVSSGK